MLDSLKMLCNVAYYIARNSKPFSDFESLLQLNAKLGVEVRQVQ
jgi:hypothetical protein